MNPIEDTDEKKAKVTETDTFKECDKQAEIETETRMDTIEDKAEQTAKLTSTNTLEECDKQAEIEPETSIGPLTCSSGPRDFAKTVFIHPAVLAKAPGESIDAAYPIDGIGFVLLINYSHNRPGSEKDVTKLTGFFRDELGYELEVAKDNMTRVELRNCLENARTKIDTRFYCFICIVMAHGDETGIKTSDNKVQSYNEILETFDNNSMRTFAGRPKIFLINACRGENLQMTVPVGNLDHSETDAKPYAQPPIMVAETADIFAVYSTVSGFASIRDTEEGSVFIQSCVDVFKKYCGRKSVSDMTTAVQRKVQERESCQVSEVRTTLTKQLFLANFSAVDQF